MMLQTHTSQCSSHSTHPPPPPERHSQPPLRLLSSPRDGTENETSYSNANRYLACAYLAIVETIEDNLKDGDDNHGDRHGDDEGVGGGEGGLLLWLHPDGAGQQLVSLLYLVI